MWKSDFGAAGSVGSCWASPEGEVKASTHSPLHLPSLSRCQRACLLSLSAHVEQPRAGQRGGAPDKTRVPGLGDKRPDLL